MRRETLEELNRARQAGKPVVLITDLQTGVGQIYYPGRDRDNPPVPDSLRETLALSVRSDRSQMVETPDGTLFIQVFNPPLRMIIVGAVHVAQALVPMARSCGYEVTVVDPREAFAAAERFPGVSLVRQWPDQALASLAPDERTAIVTLTHDPKLEDPALEAALHSPAFYIGSLGSRRTQSGRFRRLAEKGYTEREQARICGPIGLDIGARTPAEIAVSIMSEVTRTLRLT